jgi:uncharacterized protein YyaL (SSP411 family)
MSKKFNPFSKTLKDKARAAVAAAARWHRHNQVWHAWPYWTADAGRFNSDQHLHNPAYRPMLSLCWSCARAAQALISAHKLTGDAEALETAARAMEYVKSCQIFDPEFPKYHGACREETPLSDHVAARDTVEAMQGFVNLYAATKDPAYLTRARAAADWFANDYMAGAFPHQYIWQKENRLKNVNDFTRIMLGAVALPFAQFDGLTGESRYRKKIPQALDFVVDQSLEPNGALKLHDGTDAGHHAAKTGPLAGCFTNDDGVAVSFIAAYRATGDKKYKAAAERNGRWWLSLQGLPATYASIPAGLLWMMDLYRFTGDDRYRKKAESFAQATLELQVINPHNPRLHGGFVGQEPSDAREEAHRAGFGPKDYVSHRTTLYAMIGLAKLAAEKEAEWNMAYSGFGW